MIIIRPETPEDAPAIRHVNEEAFGQKEEAEIVDKLRGRGVLTISLVAVQDGEIVGHIAFSPVRIESEHSSFEAIAPAPDVGSPVVSAPRNWLATSPYRARRMPPTWSQDSGVPWSPKLLPAFRIYSGKAKRYRLRIPGP